MENELFCKFYEGFYAFLVLLIINIVVFIILIILRKRIIKNMKNKNVIYFSLLIILLVSTFFSTFQFYRYYQDLDTVKKHSFQMITGTVIDYENSYEDNDGGRAYSGPIVKDSGGNIITLYVKDTQLDKTYTFYYLENTRIAVIVENE